MKQSELELKTSLKLIKQNISKEFLTLLPDIPFQYKKLTAKLYVEEELELTHVYGSWFKAHHEDFPLDDFLAHNLGILDVERGILKTSVIKLSSHEAQLNAGYKSELPMIEPPKRVVSNHSNGRHVVCEQVICGTPYAFHEKDICLDVVNFLNQQSWKVRKPLAGTSKNLKSQPDFEDKQSKLFELYKDQKVYFPWCSDSRGRLYARNYWFNPQGDDAGKSSIELSEPEMVTRAGEYWLWVDLGTSLGLDKLSFFVRALKARKAFFKGVEYALKTYEPEDINILNRTWEACEKMLNNEPVSHMVSMDATSSGMQIASCLVGDEKSMVLTNIISNGVRNDAYSILYNRLLVSNPETPSLNNFGRKDMKKAIMTINYGSTQQPKLIFGDDVDKFMECMNKECSGPMYVNKVLQSLFSYYKLTHEWDMPDGFHVKVPSRRTNYYEGKGNADIDQIIFGVDEPTPGQKDRGMAANTIHSLDAFVLREVIRMAKYDGKTLSKASHALTWNQEGFLASDYSEEGINVIQMWRNTKILSARLIGIIADKPSIAQLLTKDEKRKVLDLIYEIDPITFQIMPIHDCFRCHPNYTSLVQKYYRSVMARITKGGFLQYLVNHLNDDPTPISIITIDQEAKDALAEKVKQSVYAIC